MITNQEIDHDLLLYLNEDSIERKYWINTLKSINRKTFIPNDLHEYNSSISIDLFEVFYEKNLSDAILKIGKDNPYSIQIILNTALAILLKKYIQEEQIAINNPIYKQKEGENYINTFIPVIIQPDDKLSFIELIRIQKDFLIESIKNQNFPVLQLFKRENRTFNMNEWFTDISLSITNIHNKEYLNSVVSNLLFEFTIESQISCTIHYNSGLYSVSNIKNILEHLEYILFQVTQNPKIKISDIEILEESEKDNLIHQNNSVEKGDENKVIHQLFYHKVKLYPKQEVIISTNKSYTYEELNKKTNQLAHFLQSKGVRRNSLVPILADPSPEMIIGILGIIKAGGAYIPVSPEYPESRVSFILKDSNAKILLTTSEYKWDSFNIMVIDINDPKIEEFDNTDLVINNESEDVVYSIYTSGSTGTPKGVLIEHASVLNILTVLEDMYPLGNDDAFLLKTNYTFDVSVTEIFGWFFGNGKLVILDKGSEKDPKKIVECISKYEVTHLNYVPSNLSVFLDVVEVNSYEKLRSLKYLFVAGEAFQTELLEKVKKLDWIQVENIYGPTEGTIYTTYYSLNKETLSVPIGKPLINISVYNLNKNKQLQPKNLPGELCVGGIGVARGYLNRPELTDEKFFHNLFTGSGRIYKTGDLMRLSDDGNIEYLGRIDHQVKIRGYRIELEEIEKRLSLNSGIDKCIVVKKTNESGYDYLCAYYISTVEHNIDTLRHFVLESLPGYMCPEFFIKIDSIPYTLSGKIDLQGLPNPVLNPMKNKDYLAPTSSLQKQIAEVWENILGVKNIGINDNFFLLGGNSTKAILLSSELEKILNREVSVVDLFEYFTIDSFINYLSKSDVDRAELLDDPERLTSIKENRLKQRNKRLQK